MVRKRRRSIRNLISHIDVQRALFVLKKLGFKHEEISDPKRRRFIFDTIQKSTLVAAELKFGVVSTIAAMATADAQAQTMPSMFWKTNSAAPNPVGPIYGWGYSAQGIFGNGIGIYRPALAPVAMGDDNWKRIEVDHNTAHVLGLKDDGTLWTTGYNSQGQLGLDDTTNRSFFTQIPGTWTDCSVGHRCSAAIKSDGTLWLWGDNFRGRLGDNSTVDRSSPVQVNGGGTWSHVTMGDSFGMAIKTDGSLFTWGSSNIGQTGHNNTTHNSSPVAIHGGGTWQSLAGSFESAWGIRTDGTLWGWGSGAYGLGGTNVDNNHRSSQTQIPGTWKKVSVGGYHVLAVKDDDTLWAWGRNQGGQLGLNDVNVNRSSPVQIGSGTWKEVAASIQVSHAIKSDDTLWSWGNNSGDDALGMGSGYPNTSSPVQVGGFGNDTFYKVFATWANGNQALVIKKPKPTDARVLYAWGHTETGTREMENILNGDHLSAPVLHSGTWKVISKSDTHTLGIQEDGTMWVVGTGTSGKLGLGDTANVDEMKQIPGSWIACSVTRFQSAGIKSDNTLWTWGSGFTGNTGQNTTNNSSSPVQVGGNWTHIVATHYGMHGIKSDGTLWSWGTNYNGRLGDDQMASTRSSPVQITGGGTWIGLAANSKCAFGIKNDNTLWAWGEDDFGQQAQNNTGTDRSSPVQITGTWKAIETNYQWAMGIKNDDTLWAWGRSQNGRLGGNNNTGRSSPVQVTGGGTWKAIGMTQRSAIAVKTDGTLWCWGRNNRGQVGDGTTTDRSSPVQIGSDTNWEDAFKDERDHASNHSAMAVKKKA